MLAREPTFGRQLGTTLHLQSGRRRLGRIHVSTPGPDDDRPVRTHA